MYAKDNWETLTHEYSCRHLPGDYWQCFYCPDECLQIFRSTWGLTLHLINKHGVNESLLKRIEVEKVSEADEDAVQREILQNAQWKLPFEWKDRELLTVSYNGTRLNVARKCAIKPPELPLFSTKSKLQKLTRVSTFPRPQEICGSLTQGDAQYSKEVIETLRAKWGEQVLHIVVGAYEARSNLNGVELSIVSRKTGVPVDSLAAWFKLRKSHFKQLEKEQAKLAEAESKAQEALSAAKSQEEIEVEDGFNGVKKGSRRLLSSTQKETLKAAFQRFAGELPADMKSRQELVETLNLPWKTVRNWFNNRKYRPLATKTVSDDCANQSLTSPTTTKNLSDLSPVKSNDKPAKPTPQRRGRKPKQPLASQGIFTARISWGFDDNGYIIGIHTNSPQYPRLLPSVAELVAGNTVTLDVHISGLYYEVDKPVPWLDNHPLTPFFLRLNQSPLRISSSISTREAVDLWTQYFTDDSLARPSDHHGINHVYLLHLKQAVENEPTGQELLKHLNAVMHANEQACQLHGRGFELLLTLPKDSSTSFIGLLKFEQLPTLMFSDVAKAVSKMSATQSPISALAPDEPSSFPESGHCPPQAAPAGDAMEGSQFGPDDMNVDVSNSPQASKFAGDDGTSRKPLPPLQAFNSSFLSDKRDAQLDTEFAARKDVVSVVNTIHNLEFKVSLHSGPWLSAPPSVHPSSPGQSILATCAMTDMSGFVKRLIATLHNQRLLTTGKPVRVYIDQASSSRVKHSTSTHANAASVALQSNCATAQTNWEGVTTEDIGLRYFDKTTRKWTDTFGANPVNLKTLQLQALKIACELV